jgi:hypothetical protein
MYKPNPHPGGMQKGKDDYKKGNGHKIKKERPSEV